ncbi:MAG: hypothetical protein MJY46_05900 [Bacteroidales bacterium]|nr:hypothetical protein [Bacteroidales bacterium]
MKRTLYLFALTAILFSCNPDNLEPVKPADKETAEDIILAVEKIYTVDTMAEDDSKYVFTFENPIPVTVKEDHPEGIPEVTLKKSDVKNVNDGERFIDIEFKDGKTASLPYGAWLSVEMDRKEISFDEKGNPETISIEVKDAYPTTLSVSVRGCESWVEARTELSQDGRKGAIIFSPKSPAYFKTEATVEVSNGKRVRFFSVPLVREDFKFADGTVEKSFAFREYERYFEIGMHKSDTAVHVVVPSECASWLKATISTVNVDGADKTTVCFLLSENVGTVSREARVVISKEGNPHELSVSLNQIGSAADGSLRKGLETFYSALNGSSWNRHDNWCTDAPLFEWYGIKAGSVVSKAIFGDDGFAYFGTDDRWTMDLAGNNMRGRIPDAFWKACGCFESIRICNEYLPDSSFPDYVWNENLLSVDLSMSFMNVSLTSIAQATNIQSLSLQACKVSGIPAGITSCRYLRELNLRECGISGTLPQNLGSLSSLAVLLLDHNMDLGGTLPDSFYELVNLKSFDIGSTRIGGVLSSKIARLTHLEDFYIAGCEFEGTIPEEFGELENLAGYDFQGNYFSAIPQFVRYRGFNSRYYKQWVGSAGFPLGVPYYQRDKKDGRPEGYIVVVPNAYTIPDILVDGQPLSRKGYYVDYEKCRTLPFPMWARIKYGIFCWNMCRDGEFKNPEFPYADDLQYPATEYYYDGSSWRHPKLEYPAREYWFNGSSWVHDAACPWDREYIDSGDTE